MERNYKISIPQPCREDWNKMMTNENGRFCMSCSKTVTDFTSMLPEEIQHFFIQNQNERICGRFRKSQLNYITIQVPSHILYSQTNYYKIFFLALFVTMGTTLFSCSDKDGNKKRIDNIEVIQNHVDDKKTVLEIALPPKEKPKDSIKQNITLNKKPFKFKNPSVISCAKTNVKDSIVEDDTFIMGAAIETKADFPNGINAFYEFFIKEFKLPESVGNLKNPILVSFVIDRDGSLTSYEFPKDIDPLMTTEITRVLKLSPKWVPGTQNGKNTRIKYSMPITFQTWEENTK